MDNTLKTLFAAGLLAASTSAYADYTTDLGLVYSKIDNDLINSSSAGLGLGYYFDPIKTDKLHRYIASEYTKTNAVEVIAALSDLDYQRIKTAEGDISSYGIRGQYAFTDTPISLMLGYTNSVLKAENKLDNSKADVDDNSIELGMKYYYGENDTVTLASLEQGKEDTNDNSEKSSIKSTRLNFGFAKLTKLGSTPLSFEFGLSHIKSKPDNASSLTNTNIATSIILMPSNTVALNAEFETNSGDNKEAEGRTLGFGVAFFPTDVITINISTSRFSAKVDSEVDTKSLTLYLGAQF